MKPVTYRTALEVASHEAVVREAYKDSVGKWTWSVGLTDATGHDVERYIDNPQPLERCLEVYVWALDRYAEAVRDVFDGHDMTEAQFAAALSFHWNTGAIRRATWCKHWKAGNMSTARASFMEWKNPPEILDRRKAEAALLFDGVWSNRGTMPEYTRLTSSHTPVWGSRREIDVSAALGRLLADEQPAAPTAPSQPENPTTGDETMPIALGAPALVARLAGYVLFGHLGIDSIDGIDWNAATGVVSFNIEQLAQLALGGGGLVAMLSWRSIARRLGGKL